MKTYHLLLLISLCGADAFQLPLRNVAIPLRKLRTPVSVSTTTTNAPYNKTGYLLSKFTKAKLLTKQSFAKTKQKQDEIDNKQLLSIVTTCCLLLILRPRTAHAYLPAQAKLPFNPLLDPTTLTYDIPGIDTLSNGIHEGAYNVGAIEILRRKALWLPLLAVALGTWFYGGLVYYSTLLDGLEMGTYEDDYNISQDQDESVDWKEYSQVLLGPSSSSSSSLQSNEKPQATKTPQDDFKLESANRYYQEQQYKQHHHPVHVSRTKFEPIKYLDTLAVNTEEVTHDEMPKTYLDTLSSSQSTWDEYKHQLSMSRPNKAMSEEDIDKLQIMKNLLTWDDYKHLVSELQSKKNEVNGKLCISYAHLFFPSVLYSPLYLSYAPL